MDLNTLHPILTECRVTKSELELTLIQFANDISSEAHVEVNILCLCYFLVSRLFLSEISLPDISYMNVSCSLIIHSSRYLYGKEHWLIISM